jgi:hypothetical protein
MTNAMATCRLHSVKKRQPKRKRRGGVSAALPRVRTGQASNDFWSKEYGPSLSGCWVVAGASKLHARPTRLVQALLRPRRRLNSMNGWAYLRRAKRASTDTAKPLSGPPPCAARSVTLRNMTPPRASPAPYFIQIRALDDATSHIYSDDRLADSHTATNRTRAVVHKKLVNWRGAPAPLPFWL